MDSGPPEFQQVHNVPEGETWTRTWTLQPTGNTRLGDITYGYRAGCLFADSFFGLGTNAAIQVTDSLGPITAYRSGPRDYSFTGLWRGPANKVINRYRHHEGRRILTAQTRTGGEFYTFHRRLQGSGAFNFSVATGTDISSTGASSPLRWTVLH